MMDQWFFANLVDRHGAGSKPLPVKRWRVDVLADRLRDLASVAEHRRQASGIALRMAKENGPARALEVVRSVIGAP